MSLTVFTMSVHHPLTVRIIFQKSVLATSTYFLAKDSHEIKIKSNDILNKHFFVISMNLAVWFIVKRQEKRKIKYRIF